MATGRKSPQVGSVGIGDAALDAAVELFGRSVARKLGRGGDPEDQLRGPTERLLDSLGRLFGLDSVAYGEVALRHIHARPDYAVDVGGPGAGGARVGYIELKAPGRGVPPKWKPVKRERLQFERLSSLPNVIYSDGLQWAHFSYGQLVRPVVELSGDFTRSGTPLTTSGSAFEAMIRDFLLWTPEAPRSLASLIRVVAGLSRLLRDEVAAVLTGGGGTAAYDDLSLLATDWRDLLFPELDDVGFSDAYAQTVTFALLLARADGVAFGDNPIHEIAKLLGKKHSLMGRALAVLTDSDVADDLRTIDTLRRVIGAVDWAALDDGKTDLYADLYERFLDVYSPELRKQSGSYYTPQPVAQFMVDFVDSIIRSRLHNSWGLASDDLTMIDPAMGTGTFLIEILRCAAARIDEKQGKGARPARLRQLFQERLVGFEIQAAPYAVTELRLHEALKTRFETDVPRTEVRFLTDALENPVAQQERLSAPYRVIGRSRAEANRIKRESRVMVVIGNPPHVENSRGKAPWVELRRKEGLAGPGAIRDRPSLDEFRNHGTKRYESDLYGLPWCFWRWAIWKAFEAHEDAPEGVVAFLTPASFIKGRSFAGMREYLRRISDEGWLIDLSPEGNRPAQSTRLFGPAVGRQLCIAIFARYGTGDSGVPAKIKFTSLVGTATQKLASLGRLSLDDGAWSDVSDEWTAPFVPGGSAAWRSFPALGDLMPWSSRGVTAGRTWIIAPDLEVLRDRWQVFSNSRRAARRELFIESRDRKIDTTVAPLPGYPEVADSLADGCPEMPPVVEFAYRPFDRQILLADSRLMVMPRPPLWSVRSEHQICLTEQSNHSIRSGPAVTFTELVADIDHHSGRSGRVIPLFRSGSGVSANFAPGLLGYLSGSLRVEISPEDLMAYVAGIAAHSSFTERFRDDLTIPGVRVPLTADPRLWCDVVAVGRKVLYLHTHGQRFSVLEFSDVSISSLIESGARVRIPIPDDPERMPTATEYDPANWLLHVGEGVIENVSDAVYKYNVDGMMVVRHWLNYRLASPRYKRRSSALDDINCRRWTSSMTDQLLRLLAIVQGCVNLESQQTLLLDAVCGGPLITNDALIRAGVFPVGESLRRPWVDESPETSRLF